MIFQVSVLSGDPAAPTHLLGLLSPDAGFHLEGVQGFDAGVRAMAANVHDVYLVDDAPGTDDRDGLKLLRAGLAAGCRGPVLLLAADGADHGRLTEAIAAGVVDYLPKSGLNGAALGRALRLAVARHARCELLHAVAAQLTVAAGRVDAQGAITGIEGPLLAKTPGYAATLVGRNVFREYPLAAPAVRRALAGETARLDWPAYFDGGFRQLEGCLVPEPGPRGGGVLFFVRDVTERRRLERELLEINDRAQRRLGQDLHDGLGQQLAGTTYLGEMLARELAERGAPEAAAARQIVSLLGDAIHQTRELARGLCPVDLGNASLLRALAQLAANLEARFGVRCAVADPGGVAGRLAGGAGMATHLYRIAQEAMHNAVRHGHARQLDVCLDRADREGQEMATLSVGDDGAGFDGRAADKGGLGLHMMRYRAHTIGGTLEISPGEGGGTRVRCTFPLASATRPDYGPADGIRAAS